MRFILPALLAAALAHAAPLPIKRIVVYKNGVAFYERSGAVPAGEPAALDFRAAELDDVLKSLVIDAPGGVLRVRYEFADPSGAASSPQIQLSPQLPLAALLDQWRGARLEMNYRGSPVSGIIVSARLAPLPNQGQKQELTLLLDSGAFSVCDLDAASAIRLADPALQKQLSDALARIAKNLTPDRRTISIDLAGPGARTITARYLAPAPVWKSTYRLLLPDSGPASIEGWAIVENATGEDWHQVSITAVSGKPVSFLTHLLEARYVQRSVVELPGIEPAAPQLHAGALPAEDKALAEPRAAFRSDGAIAPLRGAVAGGLLGAIGGAAPTAAPPSMELSNVGATAAGREAGELFEYSFPSPVNARAGESLLLPFFQGKIEARKLLIYSDRTQSNPRYAAEITNTTGKTLDGGPITVYHSSGYSGEALMDVLKNGEKRLISYAVDPAVRITTMFESGEEVIRSLKASRGVLTTRTAVQRTTVYTAANADAKEKSLLIEHSVTPGWKLVKPKPDETTPASYRFAAALPAQGVARLAVAEEHEIENSTAVTSLTPDILVRYIQNRALSAAARSQLETIAAKKREIADADSELRRTEADLRDLDAEQDRLRQNINTLRNVAGQQEQVNRYAADLAKGDIRITQLRDRLSELRRRKATLENELNALIEKLEF
jgi:hypothetical protein